jgi:hypothetical protein
VADERVQGDDVELVIAVGHLVGVADLVGDVAGQPLLGGEPPGGLDQGRAVVEAGDGRVRPGQTPEGADFDAGAAAEGQDPPGLGERQPREVGLGPPRVAVVGAAELQPGGDGLQHRRVHAWREAVDVVVIAGDGHFPAFLARDGLAERWRLP